MENIPCLYYTFHSFFVADRYKSLADLDKPKVRVMLNQGEQNE